MGEVSDSPRFDSLVFGATPWTRWASSLILNASVVIALVLVPITMHEVIQPRHQVADITLTPPPPIPKPIKPIIRIISPPITKPMPHVEFHAPPVKAPEAKTVALPPPPVEIPKPVAALQLEAPKIDLPARLPVKQEVKLDVFQAKAEPPVAQAAPVKSIQTGGFGDSAGVSSGTSTKKVLAIGGFDSTGGTGSGPARSKAVVSAGFGAYDAPLATQTAKVSAPRETPVEIVFKPKPLYTPEAREKKVEGEVTLEVTFSASGEIRVLRVVHGLGFGLDDSARAAANQIRFHPGTRNGSPVDVTGIVHIVFELS